MSSEKIIAMKEFRDYVVSKRFLLILTVLLFMSIAAIITGVASYKNQLANYNQQLSQPANITPGVSVYQPVMPSMMLIFESFSGIFVNVGWLLAIAIGFDLISKEKESGSLKLLLARPTYRDSIINGKIIGATALLVVSIAATLLITIALLLFQGIVPTGDDLISVGMFFLLLILFSLAFLAIAVASSTLAKNSTLAILMAIGFVVFSLLIPYCSSSISGIVLGPAPPEKIPITGTSITTSPQATSPGPHATHVPDSDNLGEISFNGVRMVNNPEYMAYQINEWAITGVVNIISPIYDFTSIASALIRPIAIDTDSDGIIVGRNDNRLLTVIPQIISLVMITIAGFAIAYVRFLRMDVR